MESYTRISTSTFLIFFWELFAQPHQLVGQKSATAGAGRPPFLRTCFWKLAMYLCLAGSLHDSVRQFRADSLKGPCSESSLKATTGSQQKGWQSTLPQGTDGSLQNRIDTIGASKSRSLGVPKREQVELDVRRSQMDLGVKLNNILKCASLKLLNVSEP